jgi:fructose-1,6-bisphosphatase
LTGTVGDEVEAQFAVGSFIGVVPFPSGSFHTFENQLEVAGQSFDVAVHLLLGRQTMLLSSMKIGPLGTIFIACLIMLILSKIS